MEPVLNPSEAALLREREIADALVEAGLVEEDEKFQAASVRWYQPETDDGYVAYDDHGERTPREEVVVTSAYRPGGPAFATKTVRVAV